MFCVNVIKRWVISYKCHMSQFKAVSSCGGKVSPFDSSDNLLFLFHSCGQDYQSLEDESQQLSLDKFLLTATHSLHSSFLSLAALKS